MIKKYLLSLNCFILSLIFCVSFSSLLFFQEMLSTASLCIYDSFTRLKIKEGISPSNIRIKERKTTEKIIYALKKRKLIKKYLLILNCFILSLIFCFSFSSLLFFQEMLSRASLYIYDSFTRSKIKEGIRVQKKSPTGKNKVFWNYIYPCQQYMTSLVYI